MVIKRFLPFLIPLVLFVFSFILYLHNLSSSVYGGDVGDLVTAAFVGGVPHAPGYPLFTFIGVILIRIFSFVSPAFAVGLISVLAGALGVVLFFLTLRALKIPFLVAIIVALSLATNYLFWFYNEIAEVFSLNTFFIILLFFLAVLYRKSKKVWYFLLFCFVLGLSFTHHQTIILFVPSLLLLVVPTLFKERKKWKKYLWAIPCFSVGLLPYIYVPIASSHNPPINWDNVHDIESFFHLVLRKDYGTFRAGGYAPVSMLQRVVILKSYFSTLLFQLTIPVVVISTIGIIQGLRRQKMLTFSLILAFILSGPLFITYAGFPLVQNFFFGVNERFFTMSTILVFYFFAFGIDAIRSFVLTYFKRPMYGVLFTAIFLLIPLQLLFYNFPKTDLSTTMIGDTLGYDFIAQLPPHAVVLMSGDTPLFNTLYMHYAKGVRPDVDVVNIAEMERNPYIKKQESAILKREPELKDTPPELTIATINEVSKNRPVFSTMQVQSERKKLTWIPYGLSYRLLPSGAPIPSQNEYIKQIDNIWSNMHIPQSEGKISGSYTIAEIPSTYSSALLASGAYISSQYNDSQKAKQYYEKAISVSPTNQKAYEVLGVFYLTDEKNCSLARDNFTNAIEQSPTDELAYLLLYATYRDCLHDQKNAASLATIFEKRFNENILSALKRILPQKEVKS